VLYSINVFITFTLSQLGMVRHWWRERGAEPAWKKKLAVNGAGLLLTSFILASLTIVKFHDGGWATLLVTGLLVAAAFGIKRHYARITRRLRSLDAILPAAAASGRSLAEAPALETPLDPRARTAVIFVNGFNGLGLHTLLHAMRLFSGVFKNYVFVQVGVVDAGNFKGASEIERLREHIQSEAGRYADYMRQRGLRAEVRTAIGPDAIEEIERLAPEITARFPNAVFFGGQLVFERETFVTRWLHNHTVFALQRRFYLRGLPFVILPIRVEESAQAA